MKKPLMLCSVMTVALCATGFAALPDGLVGDGQHDDTAAIQALLDSGRSLVYLPPPPKEYLISKTLKIGSNTELKLDRYTRIRLAPNAKCPMLQNRDFYTGTNVNIAVTGGCWDYDNVHQSRNPFDHMETTNSPHPELEFFDMRNYLPNWDRGELMRFSGVRNITAKDLTLMNPSSYGFVLNRANHFTVRDIVFDYEKVNGRAICMDGVHLDSNCHYGHIAHLRGQTYDDMVALNCNDWWDVGPITDVVIEDVYLDRPAFRAVRLLSKAPDAPVKRIVIRDIRGKFYTDVIGFTRYWYGGKERGVIDDVLVENIYASRTQPPEIVRKTWKQRSSTPLFQFQGGDTGLDVGRVIFRNIVREEGDIGTPTIWVNQSVRVKELVLRDIRMVNNTKKPILFFDGHGKIDKVVTDNVLFEGDWKNKTHPWE